MKSIHDDECPEVAIIESKACWAEIGSEEQDLPHGDRMITSIKTERVCTELLPNRKFLITG